ncbi:MAG TPA: cohesin domain-containing protein [candidate division Zixibacteria bacterium]|nr:cohesin domain-containing protein [candidate division Zixibacteria bacterium]
MTNTKSFLLSLAILALLLQPALNIARSVNAEEQPQTTVRIFPTQTGNLAVGDSLTVNVSAENCVDIYAVQLDIHYDTTVLKLDEITPASVFQFPFIINRSNIYDEMSNLTYNGPTYGQVYYVASRNDLLGPSGVNGGVLLFTVTFTVISDGSSSIQLIPYPGGGSVVGTYFMTPVPSPTTGFVEVIPQLFSANYGQPASPPTSSSTSTSDNNGQVLSATALPYLIPFAFAALFLVVIRRRITRKTPNP